MRQIQGLTGVRWLAAFWVFIFHVNMGHRTPLTWLPWRLKNIVQQGPLGVTVFFVLSGFVLAYSHQRDFHHAIFRGKSYYFTFMLKRVARLYPVYLIGLLAAILVSIKLNSLPGLRVVAANFLMITPYYPPIAMQWYSGGAWSICNEMFFYLAFPLVYPLSSRVRSVYVLLALILLFSSVGFISGLSSFPNHDDALHYAFPPLRLAEFTAGVAGAILTFRRNWRVPSWAAVAFDGSYLFVIRWLGVAKHCYARLAGSICYYRRA